MTPARYSCYGAEIAYEPCDNPECDRGVVLDEEENGIACGRCRGTGGWFRGEAMSYDDYLKLPRREQASHFATYYPEQQATA